jgi:hypothetical protein
MEKLIVIAIIVLASIVHSWMQRKQEESGGESTPDPEGRPRRGPRTGSGPPPRRPAPPGPANWEEELRRLLHGDIPAVPPPIAPPPVPPPMPAPSRASTPAAPLPVLARTAIPVPDEGMEMEVGLSVRPVTLHQAASAHDRAQVQTRTSVHDSVVQRMQDTANRVTAHTKIAEGALRAVRSATLRELLRDRSAQRTAIVAAIILGPPRGLEPIR